MVIITFIRHGETDFNRHGILQGHLNTPLNDNGRRQAIMAGQRLNGEHNPIDMVISSDLDRAQETASLIVDQLSERPSRPIITTPLLRERYLGKLEGVDLRQFVNWEELPEAKKMIELQNILSHKSNLNSLITPSASTTDSYAIAPPVKLTSEFLKHLPQKELKLESKRKLIKRAKEAFQFILRQIPYKYHISQSNEFAHISNHSNNIISSINSININSSSISSSISSNSSSSNNSNSVGTGINHATPNIFMTQSQLPPASAYISTSASSLSSFIDSEDLRSTSSLTSSSESHSSASSTSSISSFEVLHHDEHSTTISTNNPLAAAAISTKEDINIINSSSSSITNNKSTLSSQQSTPTAKNTEFHILVVSHSLTLKVILSLLLCKRQQAKQLLFCQNQNLDVTQSEQSSRQNFKWVQFELKNASIVRTNFSIIEKKSSDHTKLLPRDVFFSPVTTVETASG
ncbi:hypothetical protein SAMD00019534_045950 [Acytostelium subglobosum LB1]|uniref:hypothetical protein n=1 Tax=Acytostelium subglobosum LB1 TaxID=1410327 RepID=UPI000644E7C4|nr:hypothetical protein SAMD00019534_045950 [Acytostelium subglobosum LB1]GAM21420.1 hypothetical protein SAMD00019534_045950 [Acytostelium subglobosum LB1]|eukprot:XP_012755539.1 hypothetical protein SAMD00019534_045950 [Acytostelium subglobosum LB1]